jgi:hypothetical protein
LYDMVDYGKDAAFQLAEKTMAPSLTELANQYGSDKGDVVGNAHNYTLLYQFLFEQWRTDSLSLLEIGLQRGVLTEYPNENRSVTDAPSIRMWLDYFPRAKCYGFDNADFSFLELPRFTFVRGDLSSKSDLSAAACIVPDLRFVVDDGSHASWHQQLAFIHLFPKIEPSGYYIIEDLDFQPPYEGQLPRCKKTADLFLEFTKTRQLRLSGVDDKLRCEIESWIGNILIFRDDSAGDELSDVKMIGIQKAARQ